MRIFFHVVFMGALSQAVQIKNLNLSRIKREDDRWVWGYADFLVTETTESPQPGTTLSPLDEMDEDPCAPYEPKKPDLSGKMQKISDLKCFDYVWDMQVVSIRSARERKCNIKKGLFVISVVGGTTADDGEFPHLAAIGWQGVDEPLLFKCGGSLISDSFVLTAAHCASSPADTQLADTVPKMVRLGRVNILPIMLLHTDVNIKNIIKHPKYKSPRKYFDIALLQLEKAVMSTDFIRPACLWTKADVNSIVTPVSVAGWGVLQEKSKSGSANLQKANIELIDSKTCDEYLQPFQNRLWDGLDDTQICAGNLSGGVDVCQGDSGGPLQVEMNLPPKASGRLYSLLGVTAFGIGCARADSPGVYTRVSSFIDWIEKIVWP